MRSEYSLRRERTVGQTRRVTLGYVRLLKPCSSISSLEETVGISCRPVVSSESVSMIMRRWTDEPHVEPNNGCGRNVSDQGKADGYYLDHVEGLSNRKALVVSS